MRKWLVILVIPVILGMVPRLGHADSFSVGVSTGHVSVGVHLGAAPQMVVVPGLPVYRAPEVNGNYFYYSGQYYLEQDGVWFAALRYNGPWVVVRQVPAPVLAVPVTYYKMPPGQAKKGDHWTPSLEPGTPGKGKHKGR